MEAKKKSAIISLILLSAALSNAQPATLWSRCLGGSDRDYAYSIRQTFVEDFIVAGYSFSNDGDVAGNHGNGDYLVARLNLSGEIEWQRCLGGTNDDLAYSIEQTEDCGFIIAGYTNSNDFDVSGWHVGYSIFGLATYDYWIVKLNPAGAIEWQRCLGGSGADYAKHIQPTGDGGYIVAGESYSNDGDVSGWHEGYDLFGVPTFDYWVAKLSSTGDLEWQRCLGGSNEETAFSIQQTSDGGFIIAGNSWSDDGDVSGNHGKSDYWIVKLSVSGSTEWQRCFGGTNEDYAHSIKQTSDGGYIIAGFSNSNDGDVTGWHVGYDISGTIAYSDCWIVKLDSSGAIAWQCCLGGSLFDEAYSIQQTADGGYIVAGNSGSVDGDVSGIHGSGDYWIAKLDTCGSIIWQLCLGGSGVENAYSVHETTDKGFAIAGYTTSDDGDVSGTHGSTDLWIVRLSPETSVEEASAVPEHFSISAFPNPFNSAVTISLDVPVGAGLRPARVEIFDLSGRRIAQLPSPSVPLPAGEGGNSFSLWEKVSEGRMRAEFTWQPDASIGSGVYLVRVNIDGTNATKRVVYLK